MHTHIKNRSPNIHTKQNKQTQHTFKHKTNTHQTQTQNAHKHKTQKYSAHCYLFFFNKSVSYLHKITKKWVGQRI